MDEYKQSAPIQSRTFVGVPQVKSATIYFSKMLGIPLCVDVE